MGIKRYELTDAQWAKVAPLLPGKAGDPGRTGSDNRLFVNGCLWVLRSGAHWCDLPERYGRWKTVHRRFSRCNYGASLLNPQIDFPHQPTFLQPYVRAMILPAL